MLYVMSDGRVFYSGFESLSHHTLTEAPEVNNNMPLRTQSGSAVKALCLAFDFALTDRPLTSSLI